MKKRQRSPGVTEDILKAAEIDPRIADKIRMKAVNIVISEMNKEYAYFNIKCRSILTNFKTETLSEYIRNLILEDYIRNQKAIQMTNANSIKKKKKKLKDDIENIEEPKLKTPAKFDPKKLMGS